MIYLIDKKNPGSRKDRQGMGGHVANSGVVNESPEEQQESYNKENPPQPVLAIKISREVGREPNNQDPFDQRQSKARDGSVASSRRRGQTEGQEEADPVKEERHEKCKHEYPIVPNTQLIRIIKAVSGNEVLIPVGD